MVPLRRLGKHLGCEKLILKKGRMQMQFVSNTASPYYKSAAFDKIIQYIGRNPRRCNLKETGGKRAMTIADVTSVGEAVSLLRSIDNA